MKVKLFGIRIYISYIFVCSITIFIAIDRSGLFLPLLLSIMMHEAAHIIALRFFGCKIKSIRLSIGTIGVDYLSNMSKNESIISLLAGPLFNLIVANFMYFVGLDVLFGVNFIIGLVNLLPIMGLDGGSIIETMFSGIISAGRLSVIMYVISCATILFLIALNIIFLSNNVSVIIFCIYLILPIILKILLKER